MTAPGLALFYAGMATVGLRVDDDAERMGLDLSEHDENAYALEA